MIGLITPDTKQTGKRSAGNPHAAFDVAGVGNVTMVCRTAVHRESDGITTDAYRARACSRPYLRGPGGRKAAWLLGSYVSIGTDKRPCGD